jgi:hypothetical protein
MMFQFREGLMCNSQSKRHVWHVTIVGLLLSLVISQASAGTVTAKIDPIMGCFAELSGPIAKGDTEKLRPHIERFKKSDARQSINDELSSGKFRVCLNSPGGSLVEGVALAKLFNDQSIGTAVGRGKSCLSACAVAFMGGLVSYENDVYPQPNRLLHPLGKLGFHAPDLDVPKGQYAEETVKRAYLIAVKSVSSVLEMSLDINFPTSLATVMLATSAQDMHMIATIGEAARWRIAVGPVIEPAKLTVVGLAATCGHIDFAADDIAWYRMPSSTTTIKHVGYFGWEGDMEDGFQQEGATGCGITFRPLQPGDAGRTLPSGWASISANSVHVWPYQTYPPETKIVSLALADDNVAQIVDAQTRTRQRHLTGRCIVLKGTTVADNDPCTVSRIARLGDDLRYSQIDTFIWPSGAKTVVETGANDGEKLKYRLNGIDTERDNVYWETGIPQRNVIVKIANRMGKKDPMILCWPNPSSGNRFCFLDNKTETQSPFFLSFN